MTYRLTAERIGDTVLVQLHEAERRTAFTMGADDAVTLGWELLAMGAADAPPITPEAVITGWRL